MPSADAWLSLARWPNALLAAGGVLVGAWWAHGSMTTAVGWAMLAAMAIAAAANAWNDIADVEIDRQAHPERPLPRGALLPDEATRFAWIAAALAVAFAVAAATPLGLLTIVVLALARLYSPALKGAGLPGNATVAVVASLPFLYGAWAVDRPAAGAVLVLIAVPLHLAREIAKDLDDSHADAAWRRTIPLAHGARLARRSVAAAAGAFLLALAVPAARAPLFAVALLPAVALSLAGATVALWGRRGGPRYFKLAMLCAMLAVLVARP